MRGRKRRDNAWLSGRVKSIRNVGNSNLTKEEEKMILRMTHKLGDKIHEKPTQSIPIAENPFVDWTANLFYADRAQYIIIANTLSLYSVIILGRGITDSNWLIKRTISTLREFLKDDGQEESFDEYISEETGSFLLTKTRNRRILGSLNQLVREAKVHLTKGELSPYRTSFRLNDTLLSFLGEGEGLSYGKPREAFQKLAAHAKDGME
ncbi:hypothetical protein AKJ51_02415 [candidate division MSBL1 archaeon SCGC-AAA382A20]|uniref:DUF6933 domain-containing protein n=1 Tax=candidate division MSBL1 archaeon SCGC-AAA382A20 TaxID=1698280 RepID=A0A133VKM1_9EURY|nr:hypothetical protein AKJ51_02415 [candidate division MSBL1 archaeon SCGC-AAA382A20]